MRGEDVSNESSAALSAGSPPHARGRPVRALWRDVRGGITPACAGKTKLYIALYESSLGSPPHARGRPAPRPRAGREERITPACAGKTSLAPFSGLRSWDHPRMRGEDICDR